MLVLPRLAFRLAQLLLLTHRSRSTLRHYCARLPLLLLDILVLFYHHLDISEGTSAREKDALGFLDSENAVTV